MEKKYSDKAMQMLQSVTGKRARTVIDLILKNGQVTTEDLQKAGYEHAPRAVRDVREKGIPIVTSRAKGADGKNIAVYTFGDLEHMENVASKAKGRNALSAKLKQQLIDKYGAKCFVYLEEMKPKDLQIDHRIPYEIGGEQDQTNLDNFMLLSPSANRRKSWSCEHCSNWKTKGKAMCETCFWAHPENYKHIAGKEERAIEMLLTGKHVSLYDAYVKQYGTEALHQEVKNILSDAAQDNTDAPELVAEDDKKNYNV